MNCGIAGLVWTAVIAMSVPAQGPAPAQWELTLVTKGDSMYTDLSRIERIAPHVYRAWSKYVYVNRTPKSDTEALVQKEYDCKAASRRVVSAVFYDADRAVTWESKRPGPWTFVTRHKGRREWTQVCHRVERGVLSNFIRQTCVHSRRP